MLYKLRTPEIKNPHDRETTKEEEIVYLEEDPFTSKLQTQQEGGSGSGSKYRP